MRKYGANGFTLMEVMITVVIIGILASIAYPSYTNYVTAARRSDATINLTQLAAQQEKFFTQCGGYAGGLNAGTARVCQTTLAPASGTIPASSTSLTVAGTTRDGYYNIAITPDPGPGGFLNGYTLTAAPVATSSQFAADNPKCTTITLTNTGAKGASGTDNGPNGGRCWKK